MLVCDNENMPQGKGRLSVKKIHLLLMWNLKKAGKKFSLITQRKVVGKEGQIKKKIGSSIKALHCWGAPLTRAMEPPTFIRSVRSFAMHFGISTVRTKQFNTYETIPTQGVQHQPLRCFAMHFDVSSALQCCTVPCCLWNLKIAGKLFSTIIQTHCKEKSCGERRTDQKEPWSRRHKECGINPCGALQCTFWHFPAVPCNCNSIICNMRWMEIWDY